MSDWSRSTKITRTRKSHDCHHCDGVIEVGSRANKLAGVYDGVFFTVYTHEECQEAGDALAIKSGNWGEDYLWLNQIDEHEDARFILERFPTVAARLPICARVARIDAESSA